MTKPSIANEWPSLRFARIDVASPSSVADYILWLANWNTRDDNQGNDEYVPLDPEATVEALWGWDGAPRKRMAKLLWQFLAKDSSSEHFERTFTLNAHYIAGDVASSINRLLPIQQNLKWILDALISREQDDIKIGQGTWGEDWWLPTDQGTYLRQQIRRASPDLIERASLYQDSLESAFYPYFEVEIDDPDRKYVGTVREPWREFVEIESSEGERIPLKQGHQPFSEAPGTGFSWGYPGGGPSRLALSILADAVGGDFEIAEKLRWDFAEQILMKFPQATPFAISRREVLSWLEANSVSILEIKAGASRVAKLQRKNHSAISKHKERLSRVHEIGGLMAQRFDLVPKDFECALYVDLMRSLERTGRVLRCAHCKQALPGSSTPTGNRQRARWQAGKPVYHEDCFAKHRLERKRSYWKQRAQDPIFRSHERMRAKNNRKQS